MSLSAPIHELKRKAKKLRRKTGISHNEALAIIAKEEGYASWGLLLRDNDVQKRRSHTNSSSGYLIKTLPVDEIYRKRAIELANETFEMVFDRIEPDNPKDTRALWDAAEYVDKHHLSPDMLPIDSEYALSLIEAFMLHHVIDLANVADFDAENAN